MNITHKIIKAHLVSGDMSPGREVSLRVDQTLTQDATGTMAWLQFEALGLEKTRTELSVSYVDHNTLQKDFRNPDDHAFLRTMASRFGAVYSPPGNGICHQLHLENFAAPGKVLLGSDSHTPMAGGMGCLAMGAGGLSVALAMAGEPYSIPMPKVVEVRLSGQLTGWAQAKDVILHLLGKLSTKGGVGKVLEYTGPGVATLSVPERATITNMGAELGATASLFPSDDSTREFLGRMGRENDWAYLMPDQGAVYDELVEVDLSAIVPMAAQPHMPDKVVSVAELAAAGSPCVSQVAMGSCTNSSYADLKQAADILMGRHVAEDVDVCVSPGSRQVLGMLIEDGSLTALLGAGVRVLECACGPCIGMGGAPVSKGVSVRTFNRNFEGRSGTRDAGVYLVSPITAAQCALTGTFTDPATWGTPVERPPLPRRLPGGRKHFLFPPDDGASVEVLRGPNIAPLEQFSPLESSLEGVVILKAGDDITTDHIMPAGEEITALRSNVPAIARYVFSRMDAGFVARADAAKGEGKAGFIVAGRNYGQGSSREHAALAPRHLGVRAVVAQSLARIHRANLINFGILPLLFVNAEDYSRLSLGAALSLDVTGMMPGGEAVLHGAGQTPIAVRNDLSEAEWRILKAGGLLNDVRARRNEKR